MPSSVSKRIFGDDISPDIKKVLYARQAFAKSSNPNESIDLSETQGAEFTVEPYLYSKNFGGDADLSSRTPFARMWVAVEAVHASDISSKSKYKDLKEAKKALSQEMLNDRVYVKKRKDGTYGHFRADPLDGGRAIYEIGNHLLNNLSIGPNESLEGIKRLVPDEFQLNRNEFMKPPAGIKKVSSETKSKLGAIIETNVDFTVHNFQDYENIYQKYFLRHGAQVVIDFGWDTALLYDPRELDFGVDNLGLFLHDEYVKNSHGSLEVMLGLVTKYDSKLRDDGGFDCSITVTSRNIALLDHKIDIKQKRRIKKVLDISILQYITKAFKGMGKGDTTKRLAERSDSTSFNPKTLDEWQEAYGSFANSALKSKAKAVPSPTSVKWGVYYTEEENEKSLYISYGFFEDKILNLEFGFGNKLDPGFKSLAFVTYNNNLFLRQLFAQKMTGLAFLYPENWDESYSTIREKVPNRITNFSGEGGIGPDLPPTQITQIDKEKGRIPLRELFISVDLIKKALDNSSTVTEFLKNILDKISIDSQDIFKLSFGPIDPDAQEIMKVVDENYLGMSTGEEDGEFEKMFIFKPFSENSIVKSYNLSMSTPTGNMQNMIAIQSMSPGEQMFPISSFVAQSFAMNILNQETKRKTGIKINNKVKNIDDFGVRYLPLKGREKLEKFVDDQEAGEISALNFAENDYILGGKSKITNAYLDSITSLNAEDLENLEDSLEKVDKAEKGDEEEDKKKSEENEKKETDSTNAKIAGTISSFYEILAKKEFNSGKNPILLPIKLSFSIYGISGIIPGNLIRVDYIPKSNFEYTFFHITKVTNDVSNDKWTTSFETQMRVRPRAIKESKLMEVEVDVVLSKNILKEDPVNLKTPSDLLETIKDLKINDITKKGFQHIDFVFIFTALSDKTLEPPQFGILDVGYGEVKNKKGVVADEVSVEVGDEDDPNKYYLIVQGESWVIVPKKGGDVGDWDVDVYKNTVRGLWKRGIKGGESIIKDAKKWWSNVDLTPWN